MRKGDWFVISEQRHWAFGQRHVATKVRCETLQGYDTVLDLGQMVFFRVNEDVHSVPIEWTAPAARPDLRRRLK